MIYISLLSPLVRVVVEALIHEMPSVLHLDVDAVALPVSVPDRTARKEKISDVTVVAVDSDLIG